jgi:Uma2 family endonuclease
MATTVRPAAGVMTAEEFCEFVHRPENEDRFFELDEGRVIELPPPKKRHGVICGQIVYLLNSYVRRTGRGQVTSNDAGVILGRGPDTVRGPDVAYFAEQQSDEELEAEGYAHTPPVLVVEVLSPDDRWRTVNRKVMQYLRAGVKVVWVVDPETHDVTVHRSGQEVEGLGAEDVLTGGDELPGFECRVGEFFELPGGAARA